MLIDLMRTPVVLPFPGESEFFDADDVLVVHRRAAVGDDTTDFLAVTRLRWGNEDCRQRATMIDRERLADCLTASYDTVVCYAIEFARYHGIDVIYDAVTDGRWPMDVMQRKV